MAEIETAAKETLDNPQPEETPAQTSNVTPNVGRVETPRSAKQGARGKTRADPTGPRRAPSPVKPQAQRRPMIGWRGSAR